MTNFERAVAVVFRHEGGLVDDPRDKGMITNYGISLRAYPELGREGILHMTRTQAAALYHRDYWSPLRCDDLPYPVALCVFDAGVMSGVRPAAEWLQQVLEVTVDGEIGPVTCDECSQEEPSAVCNAYTDTRLAFLRQLDTWPHFATGWEHRVLDTLREALS